MWEAPWIVYEVALVQPAGEEKRQHCHVTYYVLLDNLITEMERRGISEALSESALTHSKRYK